MAHFLKEYSKIDFNLERHLPIPICNQFFGDWNAIVAGEQYS